MEGAAVEEIVSVEALRAEYLRLVREELPRASLAHGWCLRYDHCFARVLLDFVCGGPWPEHLTSTKRSTPAYKRLSETQLREAIATAQRILTEGEPLLRTLNRQSLQGRGKLMMSLPQPR